MSAWTKAAKDQLCTLEGWYFPCSHDTTVFAHFPHNDAGIGMKCPDYFGADLCAAHHDYIDGRTKHNGQTGRHDYEAKYVAMRRTWQRRKQQGVSPW